MANVSTASTQNIAYIETSKADCTIECTFPTWDDGGLCWRVVDNSNYWLFNGTQIYKVVTDGFNAVGSSWAPGFATGDIARVVLSGNTHTVYKNGAQVSQVTDAFQASATKHGLRTAGLGAVRFDDFKVYA